MNDFYLSGGKADLAVIVSPPHYHVPQSILALHHGTNVLCDKPIGALVSDAELRIETPDKKVFSYPSPDSDHQFKKLFIAIDNVHKPEKIICSVEAALSQTRLANTVDKLCGDAPKIPDDQIIRTRERLFVKGLDDLFLSGYRDFRLVKW